jgi:hypothetical protein
MTQAVSARPGSVTAAQVIIRVLAALGAIGGALMIVLGVIGLVSGATVAAGASDSDVAGLGAVFGGLIGMFSGLIIVSGVISLAFVGLWFWIASALGRASKAGRIVATILCGIDVLWGFALFALAASDSDGGSAILPALLLLVVPATLIGLLWGSESARRFFDGVPATPVGHYAPAPMSPPVGVPRPQMPQQAQYPDAHYPDAQYPDAQYPDAVTTRFALPPTCRTCRAALQPGWGQCGRCGTPVQPGRPVGA